MTVLRPCGLAIRLRIIYSGVGALSSALNLAHMNGLVRRMSFRRIMLGVRVLTIRWGILLIRRFTLVVRAMVLRIWLLSLTPRRIISCAVGAPVCNVLMIGPWLIMRLVVLVGCFDPPCVLR